MAGESGILEWMQFAVTTGIAISTGVTAFLVWKRDNSKSDLALRDALLASILDARLQGIDLINKIESVISKYEEALERDGIDEGVKALLLSGLSNCEGLKTSFLDRIGSLDKLYVEIGDASLREAFGYHMRTNHIVRNVRGLAEKTIVVMQDSERALANMLAKSE